MTTDERVLHGEHFIPEEVIRLQYVAGLKNFFALYRLIANSWKLLDNSVSTSPTLIAKGSLTWGKHIQAAAYPVWMRTYSGWKAGTMSSLGMPAASSA